MSHELLRFVLPLPPSVNHQYATVKGRRVLSWEARTYKKKMIDELRKAFLKAGLFPRQAEPWREGYLCLSFDFYFLTPRRRDLDGGLKIAQDIICQALRINDNRVVHVCLSKRVDPSCPRMEVELKALPAWDFCRQEGTQTAQREGISSGEETFPLQPASGFPSFRDGAPSGDPACLILNPLAQKARKTGKGKAGKRPRSLEELAKELGWED